MAVQVGSPAPRFEALAYRAHDDAFVSLRLDDLLAQRRWVCLFFYPMDFSSVCPTELAAFSAAFDDFQMRNCEVVGCSADTHLVHKAWCSAEQKLDQLPFALLADPTHRVMAQYGMLLPAQGVALRGTCLIDPAGVLRWLCVNDLGSGRNVAEILRNLDALQQNEMCPCNWKQGQPTLPDGAGANSTRDDTAAPVTRV